MCVLTWNWLAVRSAGAVYFVCVINYSKFVIRERGLKINYLHMDILHRPCIRDNSFDLHSRHTRLESRRWAPHLKARPDLSGRGKEKQERWAAGRSFSWAQTRPEQEKWSRLITSGHVIGHHHLFRLCFLAFNLWALCGFWEGREWSYQHLVFIEFSFWKLKFALN